MSALNRIRKNFFYSLSMFIFCILIINPKYTLNVSSQVNDDHLNLALPSNNSDMVQDLDRDFEGFSHYYVNVSVNPDTKMLNATMCIDFFNNDDKELTNLYFHILANSGKNENRMEGNSASRRYYPEGFDPSWIKINSIHEGEIELNYTIQGQYETILNVTLAESIKPNSSKQLTIDFQEKIPNTKRRFAWIEENYETVFTIVWWIPTVAVYDKIDGWNLDSWEVLADSYYADSSYYDVRISLPKEYLIGSSGNLVETKTKEGIRTTRWISEYPIRDFAFCFSKEFKAKIFEANGVNTTFLYLESSEGFYGYADIENIVEDSLKMAEEYFGSYPYEDLTIVETYPSYAGMEYSQLIVIEKLGNERTISHEIIHQWTYQMIGNDQIDEPFTDESFASYSEYWFMQIRDGKGQATKFIRERRASLLQFYNEFGGFLVNKSCADYNVSDYYSLYFYYYSAYSKSSLILDMLTLIVGFETFKDILQLYFQRHQYQLAFYSDFMQIVKEVTNQDYDWFSNQWLNNKNLPSYSWRIINVTKAKETYHTYIEINQTEGFKNILPVGIHMEEENYTIRQIKLNSNTQVVQITTALKPTRFELDPQDRFLLLNSKLILSDFEDKITEKAKMGFIAIGFAFLFSAVFVKSSRTQKRKELN